MSNFLKGAAKLALALVFAVAALTALGLLAWKLYDLGERRKEAPYESVRDWSYAAPATLAMTVKGRTKLVDGTMSADFRFGGHPAYLDTPVNRSAGRGITVRFSDKDGFKLYEKEIPIGEFGTIVDDKGAPTGLSFEFATSMSVEQYARFSQLDISWKLDTFAHSLPAPAIEPVKPKLDHCAPGIAKAERMKRLAQYGTVREVGAGAYEAGDRSVLIYGQEVLNCR